MESHSIPYSLNRGGMASVVVGPRGFGAGHAMMLVHSFSETGEWFEDYVAFAALYGTKAATSMVNFVKAIDGNALYLGWVKGGRT